MTVSSGIMQLPGWREEINGDEGWSSAQVDVVVWVLQLAAIAAPVNAALLVVP
jgi:hypothetical protein